MNRNFVFLLCALLLTACGNKQENSEPVKVDVTPSQIVGIGKIIPQGGIIELAAPASGIVENVFFSSGDSIKKGDIILSLLRTDEELSVKEAESRTKSQQLSVGSALIAVEHERIVHEERLRLLNDAKDLLNVGATTGENVRTLQNELDKGAEQLKKLENEYILQQSKLVEQSVQQDSRASDLNKTEFRALMDGVILDINPRPGEAVNRLEQYGRLSPDNPLVAMVEIDELFAGRLEIGQTCTIRLQGQSEIAATGEVVRISPDLKKKSLFSDSGTDLEDRRIREVEVMLKEIAKPLFIESKIECSISLN